MSRYVAALLVARGGVIRAEVDDNMPGAEELGAAQPAARLTSAFARGREQRAADDDLMAELGTALRGCSGEDAARDAAREAWDIHQQRGGAGA